MARTRWPPGPVNPGLLPRPGRSDRQRRQVPKTWGPADRSISRQLERRRPIRRSGRDPGPRRYAPTSPKPCRQGRKQRSRARSTIHILPVDSDGTAQLPHICTGNPALCDASSADGMDCHPISEEEAARGEQTVGLLVNGKPPEVEGAGPLPAPESNSDARGDVAWARQTRFNVGRVTPEEFRWQESNYDRDSRFGRELLFLIANNEWTRATSETLDLARSNAVNTTVEIDIDLDRITHEVLRHRTGRLWLPVLVIPPFRPKVPQELQEPPQHDPSAMLTVTDASGGLLATLPSADVRRGFSAALAEIIVNVAAVRLQMKTETRDTRLLLSAAIYQVAPPRTRAVLARG